MGSPPGSLAEKMCRDTPSRSRARISLRTKVCESRGHVLTTYATLGDRSVITLELLLVSRGERRPRANRACRRLRHGMDNRRAPGRAEVAPPTSGGKAARDRVRRSGFVAQTGGSASAARRWARRAERPGLCALHARP